MLNSYYLWLWLDDLHPERYTLMQRFLTSKEDVFLLYRYYKVRTERNTILQHSFKQNRTELDYYSSSFLLSFSGSGRVRSHNILPFSQFISPSVTFKSCWRSLVSCSSPKGALSSCCGWRITFVWPRQQWGSDAGRSRWKGLKRACRPRRGPGTYMNFQDFQDFWLVPNTVTRTPPPSPGSSCLSYWSLIGWWNFSRTEMLSSHWAWT